VIHGPVEQRHPVLGTGFGEDVAHVVVHGALADHQLGRNLLVGEAGGHQFHDLHLSLREIAAGWGAESGRREGLLRARLQPGALRCPPLGHALFRLDVPL